MLYTSSLPPGKLSGKRWREGLLGSIINCRTERSMVPIATAENMASSFRSTCSTISSFTIKSAGLVTSKQRFSPWKLGCESAFLCVADLALGAFFCLPSCIAKNASIFVRPAAWPFFRMLWPKMHLTYSRPALILSSSPANLDCFPSSSSGGGPPTICGGASFGGGGAPALSSGPLSSSSGGGPLGGGGTPGASMPSIAGTSASESLDSSPSAGGFPEGAGGRWPGGRPVGAS
mmetsp:Transcript_49482/g.140194  ORF Transcript_49482/g.140194 Transcript_49482/m.140194 type:complete len:233 (+) Transcript_49482:1980-2678(+)